MSEIKYSNLADCPELIDEVAKFWQAEWSSDKSATGFEKQKHSIIKNLNKNKAPFIIVAHSPAEYTLREQSGSHRDEFIGSAALFLHDLDSRPDLSPWMGGIFTVPKFRGQGIAKELIKKVENKAKELGYSKIYLHTEHTAGLYQKLGWQKLDDCATDQGEPSEIFYKKI